MSIIIPLGAIGVLVMFIVAVIQQGKQEHAGGFKQAFFTVVTLVMLILWIGGLVSSLVPTLKQFVFTNANSYSQRFNTPPTLYLPGHPGEPVKDTGVNGNTYTCTDKCDFTADDKAQFASWKTQYQDWQKRNTDQSQQFRNDLVAPLSFLIVGLPLYFVFRRLMEKGAAEELAANKKPTPLRSLYFYFLAFSGLIMAVFAAGALINTGLRGILKANDQTVISEPLLIGDQGSGVRSIIACADKCGFTAADVSLANQWLKDAANYKDQSKANRGKTDDDLSNYLPILMIGLPLFWYHFTRIRKETPPRDISENTKPVTV